VPHLRLIRFYGKDSGQGASPDDLSYRKPHFYSLTHQKVPQTRIILLLYTDPLQYGA
jgi:hypothetical protein